jgi:multidrug transporter EmrE-like cation transporter
MDIKKQIKFMFIVTAINMTLMTYVQLQLDNPIHKLIWLVIYMPLHGLSVWLLSWSNNRRRLNR